MTYKRAKIADLIDGKFGHDTLRQLQARVPSDDKIILPRAEALYRAEGDHPAVGPAPQMRPRLLRLARKLEAACQPARHSWTSDGPRRVPYQRFRSSKLLLSAATAAR
jgi:hypothetical protein